MLGLRRLLQQRLMTSCTMSETRLWTSMLTLHLLLQCGDVELNPGPSLGYEVMRSCGKKIVEGLSRDPKGLALSLFEEEMISLDTFEKTNEQNDTNSDKARRLYIALLKRAKEHPQAYNKFVKVLQDCLYDDLREHLLGEYQKASPPCGIVLEPQSPSLTEDRKTVRSGSLAASDYSSPPTSPLSESLGSASSPFSSLTADSFTRSKDRRVDTLRDKNITVIRHHFCNFLEKVERGLIECNVDFTRLKRYLKFYYQDCPDFDDISSYFEHLTQSQKWDYMNSEHLCEIVKTFGNNKTLLDDVREFRERKSTYLAYITISEYIEDKAKMSQLVSKSRRHRGRKRRGSKSYRDELSVKLDVAVTTTTLKYIEDLWRDLSYLDLPKIGIILEDIIGGCVWVVWVITLQTIVTDFRKKAKQPEAAEFFERHEIVRVYFNDECLYSAEGEELTDFIRKNILKQLTSDSIDEEPEDEAEYDCSQQVEENSGEAIDAQTVCKVVGEDKTAEDGQSGSCKKITKQSAAQESYDTTSEKDEEAEDIHDELKGDIEDIEVVKSKELEVVSAEQGEVVAEKVPEEVKSEQPVKEVKKRSGVIDIFKKPLSIISRTFKRKTVSDKLLAACRSKKPNIEVIKGYLEQEECDVNIREDDEFRWSPLMWACENNHFEIGRLLLKYQPQVNIQDKKEWSPLILACRAGDLEIVQGIVALEAELIDKPTNKLWTPLMWAAQEGHAKVAEFLLRKGAQVDFPDENGWTPLMQASQEGHVDVVNVLLDHKANANHQSNTTWCALMAAAKNKHSEVVDALLMRERSDERADVDITRNDGSTALQVASYYKDNSAVVDVLIKHKANVDHQNKDGMTALMLATSKGHLDLVQTLINGGADINKQHPETEWTAIFFAAKSGNLDIFRELLSKGAKTEIEGMNVADVASMFKRKAVTKELKKFEQAPHRQITSHVPTLESAPAEQVTSTDEPIVKTEDTQPQQILPPSNDETLGSILAEGVKPVTSAATTVQGSTPPVTIETPEATQQEPAKVNTESFKGDTEETPQCNDSEVAPSDVVKPETTTGGGGVQMAETPTQPETPVSGREAGVQSTSESGQSKEEQKSSSMSTITIIKEQSTPKQHSEARKAPKIDLKRKAEIIDLMMKGFENRLANDLKSNIQQEDFNDTFTSQPKGVQSAGVITHSEPTISTQSVPQRPIQSHYVKVDPADELYS